MWHAHAAGPACRHDGLDPSSHNSCSPWLPAVSSCCECEGTTIGRAVHAPMARHQRAAEEPERWGLAGDQGGEECNSLPRSAIL